MNSPPNSVLKPGFNKFCAVNILPPALVFASNIVLETPAFCKLNAAFKPAMPPPIIAIDGLAEVPLLLSLLLFGDNSINLVQLANAAAATAAMDDVCKN